MNEMTGWFYVLCPRCGTVCTPDLRERLRQAEAREAVLDAVAQAAWQALHQHGVAGYGNWARLSEVFAELVDAGWTPGEMRVAGPRAAQLSSAPAEAPP